MKSKNGTNAPKKPRKVSQSKTPAPLMVAGAAPGTAPEPPAAPASGAACGEVNVSFAFLDPVATSVMLAGDFNHWSPDELPLKRYGEGLWQAQVSLKPGRYHYKFIVDGVWTNDPKAAENCPNEFGTLNSVVDVAGTAH